MTSLEVDITWDALEFHPNENIKKKGGVYVAYTLSMKGGPGGYFGVQITGASGNILCRVLHSENRQIEIRYKYPLEVSFFFISKL